MNERLTYMVKKGVRDFIVAGGVAGAILWLGDNEVLAGSSGVVALGVWRVIRPEVLGLLGRE